MIVTSIHYQDLDALVTELMHLEGVVAPNYEFALGDGRTCIAFHTTNPVRLAMNIGRVLGSDNVSMDIAAAFLSDDVRFQRAGSSAWMLFFPNLTAVWD